MTTYTIVIEGPMIGKQRARVSTRGGFARAYTPAKTVNAESYVKQCALRDVGQIVLEGPLEIEMRVVAAVPLSWSRKKREAAFLNQIKPCGKPDCSNMLKLVEDALNGICWRDDSQIVDARVTKRYGTVPQTTLIIRDAATLAGEQARAAA